MTYRDRRLLEVVREAPCMVCFKQDGTVVAAHSNQLRDNKGRGTKSHDFRIAAMCYTCHTRCDQGRDLSKEERIAMWEEAHRGTIAWLFLNGKLKVVG